MQADEFEKNIQNKMEGFGLVPNDEVWKKVSIRIEKEKKKRKVVFFWLFMGLVLVAGISTSYFINNKNNGKIVINEVKHNRLKQADNKIKLTTPNSSVNSYKAKTKGDLKTVKKGNIKRTRKSEIKSYASTKITSAKVINNRLNTNVEKDNSKLYKQKEQIFQSLPPHKFYKWEKTKTKVDTTLKNSIDGKTNFRKDTSANTIVKEIRAKKQIKKKWNFGFTIYSGISDNLSDLPLLQNNAQDYFTSPGLTQYGNNYYIHTSNNFKSRFSFGFGVFLEKKLSRKISLTAGADYHLYKAKSTVGNRVRYDSSLQAATRLNEYYNIGNSATYINKYHLVELPINLGYQINKNQYKPLIISAGLSPGYLVSSNALYTNSLANVYYVDKQKFNRFQLSAQMSLSFPVIGSLGYLLSAGPVIQYGFTSVAKAVSGSDQHLFFAGINANVVLK